MVKKPRQFRMRLSEEGAELLRKSAEAAGVTQTEYMRRLLHNNPVPAADLTELLKLLSAISRNLNQLTIRAHSIGFVDLSVFNKLKKETEELYKEISDRCFGS